MNFLNNLDVEYRNFNTQGEKLYDRGYYHYQQVNFKDSYSNSTFWCLKQRKTRFIIVEELHNVKLYLTDADIIELITDLEIEVFNMLIESFHQLYLGYGEEFSFRIGEEEYSTLGLKFSEDEKKFYFSSQIETKADVLISFEDLVYLLNLILAKEEAAMNLTKEISFNRSKRQLAKYIVLSKFYRNEDKVCEEYLKEINYNYELPDIRSVYNNDRKQRHIDRKFNDEKIFEKLFIK
ncbi:hypothetical protein [Priestia aryabhattai]|uniref:hypothetical protein n=1 Tax=Priestia aryabhattai TaxID=412384 RepID=UPI001CFD2292|nr:hypothetical protein [Priestia aryabhattai]